MLGQIEEIINMHIKDTDEPTIVVPKIKSFLEHCRSILEYCAQDIFQYVVPKSNREKKLNSGNKNVYFPYGKNEDVFKQSVKKNFLGISDVIINRLITDLQDFRRFQKKKFLTYMCKLTNDNKHDQLTEPTRQSDKGISIGSHIKVDERSTVTVINSTFDGIPSGNFTIKNAKIYGDINQVLLGKVLKWDNGSFVFTDTKLNVVDFLRLCLKEIKDFYLSLYKRLEEAFI